MAERLMSSHSGKLLIALLILVPMFSSGSGQHHASPLHQDTTTKKNLPGDFIIDLKEDTLFVNIVQVTNDPTNCADSIRLQHSLEIHRESLVVSLTPTEIAGFSYRGIPYEAIPLPQRNREPVWKFCRRLLSGTVSVFAYYQATDCRNQDAVVTRLSYRQDGTCREASSFVFNRARPGATHKPLHDEMTTHEFVMRVQEFNRYLQPKTSH